jgi:TPR repeat protein
MDRVLRRLFLAGLLIILGIAGTAHASECHHAFEREDFERAAVLCRELAEDGNAIAQNILGEILYDHGRGGPQEREEAVKWFRKAAEQGYAPAQVNLGHMYKTGSGVPMNDFSEAVRWFRKAAEQKNLDALVAMGGMHLDGTGVAKDSAEAEKWFLKAERGIAKPWDVVRYYGIGLGYYMHGDLTAAAKWWRKGAEHGVGPALFQFGVMYANGHGVPENRMIAITLWYMAAQPKYLEVEVAVTDKVQTYNNEQHRAARMAARILDEVSEIVAPAELSKSQRSARECIEKDYKGCDF